MKRFLGPDSNTLRVAVLGLVGFAWSCDVEPVGLGPTGIADLATLPEGTCGRGFLVASSDYQSSNVSAMDRQGNVLSPSLVSSSLSSAELVQAFSGDLVFPTERQLGTEAIVIDRFPQSVITFLNLSDASIRAQLDVSTGFQANPHDALRLDDGSVLVTRFDSDPNDDGPAENAGGDLLLIDPRAPRILERIALTDAAIKSTNQLRPHPERMLRVGTRVFVVVSLYSRDFRQTGPSYLVTLDATRLEVVDSMEVPSLVGCAGIAASPNERELAITCSGSWGTKDGADPDASGLIGFDIDGGPIERWRLMADSMTPPQPFGFSIAYADRERVLGVALGRHAAAGRAAQRDRFVSFNVKTKETEVLRQSSDTPFTLGDVRCLSDCGRCALANAQGRGNVLIYQATKAGLVLEAEVTLDAQLGLPPRWLGTF